MRTFLLAVMCCGLFLVAPVSRAADAPAAPDYNQHVAPIFKKYCAGCHNGTDKEGELMLESYAGLLAGGEHGAAIVLGQVRSEPARAGAHRQGGAGHAAGRQRKANRRPKSR